MTIRGFVLAILLGAIIWALSPSVTGYAEPWDSQSPYYLLSLLMSGLVVGLVGPRRYFWLWPIGIVVGQVVAILCLSLTQPFGGVSFFFPIGLFALLLASIVSLIGSAIGAGGSFIWSRLAGFVKRGD